MKVRQKENLTLLERIYIFEVAKGMLVTLRHFCKNLVFFRRVPTIQYPDVVRAYPERWRYVHRLKYREDGTPRCVACFMCATACPAKCIRIVAADYGDSPEHAWKEKYPDQFEINELRCIFCGLCVEACPLDAIAMDTGRVSIAAMARGDVIFGKESLLQK
jgi:NADH-quinone oxidoreductase subunit I